MDNSSKAIEETKKMTPEGNNFRIRNIHSDFLDGSLYVVAFDTNDGERQNYVYIDQSGVFLNRNEALLIEMVSRKSKKKGINGFIEAIGGISGIIGLLITIAIIYLVVTNPQEKIPEVLSAALTMILGFYFGSQIKK